MGDREAAWMMVGGEGAKAENQRNKAFVHVCHVLPTLQSPKSSLLSIEVKNKHKHFILAVCQPSHLKEITRATSGTIMHSVCQPVFL